jgi:hypothetical protein
VPDRDIEVPSWLTQLEVDEVSFVDRAANKKKFLALKRAGGNVETDKLLRVALEGELENEADLDAFVKEHDLSDEATAAVKGALKLLEAHSDILPEATLKAALVSRFGLKVEAPVTKNGKPDLTGLDPDTAKRVEQLWKDREELDARVQKMEDERENKEYVRKAAAFSSLSVNPDDFGPALREIAKAAPDAYEKIQEVLAGANALVEKSKFYGELGSTAHGPKGVFMQLQAKADEIQKADDSKSESEALELALQQNPTLAQEYRREQRGEG